MSVKRRRAAAWSSGPERAPWGVFGISDSADLDVRRVYSRRARCWCCRRHRHGQCRDRTAAWSAALRSGIVLEEGIFQELTKFDGHAGESARERWDHVPVAGVGGVQVLQLVRRAYLLIPVRLDEEGEGLPRQAWTGT